MWVLLVYVLLFVLLMSLVAVATVRQIMLRNNSTNCKHQIRPEGGQSPGRVLAPEGRIVMKP
jgi:CHASE1-domain containing sensor protein